MVSGQWGTAQDLRRTQSQRRRRPWGGVYRSSTAAHALPEATKRFWGQGLAGSIGQPAVLAGEPAKDALINVARGTVSVLAVCTYFGGSRHGLASPAEDPRSGTEARALHAHPLHKRRWNLTPQGAKRIRSN